MVSLERCREILNKGKRRYSDEEVRRMRDLCYKLASIEIDIIKRGFLDSDGSPAASLQLEADQI